MLVGVYGFFLFTGGVDTVLAIFYAKTESNSKVLTSVCDYYSFLILLYLGPFDQLSLITIRLLFVFSNFFLQNVNIFCIMKCALIEASFYYRKESPIDQIIGDHS